MRKLVLTSFIVGLLSLSGCDTPDPSAYETWTTKIRANDERARSFGELQRLVLSVSSAGEEPRKLEFAEKVLPLFVELWDDETAVGFRVQMLEMCRDMDQPAASVLWNKAIILDGSSETRKGVLLALQGIRDARALDSVEAVIAAFEASMKDPSKDGKGAKGGGEIRMEYAKTLGVLRDKRAVPVLTTCLQQPNETQPTAVHKEAVKALGLIGDPAATASLLAVQFKVGDFAGTQSIGERANRALAAIGAGALPLVIQQLKGQLKAVNEAAGAHDVPVRVVQQSAAGALGAMGLEAATADLVAFMPKADCTEKRSKADEPDPDEVGLRAFVARSLGFIGGTAAVDDLCACRNATHNPGDLDEIVGALGRIGGDEAFSCLTDVVTKGFYDADAVANSDFVHEIRWEGVRYLLMSASSADAAKIRATLAATKDKKVRQNMAQWEPGLKTLEDCKDDKACYSKVLADTSEEWISREVAATQLSRLGRGDVGVALNISKAFKVRSPDARVTMALLASRTAAGKPCWECADALEGVMKSERGSASAKMQLAWLAARQSIAKLTRGPRPGSGEAKSAVGETKPVGAEAPVK